MPESVSSSIGLDLFGLASAPLVELLEALGSTPTAAEEERFRGLPAWRSQIAELVLAEVIRLIRLGSTRDLARDARRLARLTTGSRGRKLAELNDGVYGRLEAASIVLSAAAAPTSRGGELNVLRSWKGKALRLVAAISVAPDQRLPRVEARKTVDLSDSAFSHMLTALDNAGLVVRVKHGRSKMLHLGAVAESEHVRQLLETVDLPEEPANAPERVLGMAPPLAPGDWAPVERGARPLSLLVEPEPGPDLAAAA